MNEISFRETLRRRQEKTKSLLCVGLDPKLEKLPEHLRKQFPADIANPILFWMIGIVDKTAPFTCMYKINIAHWEAIPHGIEAMKILIAYIKKNYPDIVVFGDVKRGDIDRTQRCYGIACFDIYGFQGMNFNPYMGKDCMKSLIDPDHLGRAIVGLCYTSNIDAREMQDVVLKDGRKYWEFVAEKQLAWADELGITENAGLVMAAAYEFPKKSGEVYSEHLSMCREIVGSKLWFLIPGVGTQGGFIKQTVKAAYAGPGSMVINSSSDIIFASSGEDFAEAAGEKAKKAYLAMAEAQGVPKSELITESLIVTEDPLETMKNFDAYYKSRQDDNGKFLGPLVAYAGKYADASGPKNYVGFEYFNFAQIEIEDVALDYFSEIIVKRIKEAGVFCHSVIGAPMGGLFLAKSIGRKLGCPAKFAEKKTVTLADPEKGIKEVSKYVIDRHGIVPGSEVVIVEDVCNNFSTTQMLKNLIESKGGKLAGIVCAINRSGGTEWEGVPVIEALYIPTAQYSQSADEVAVFIANGEIEWTPKNNWPRLKAAMEGK